MFQKKFALCYTRLYIYIWKTKFSSHKPYPFGLLFPRNTVKTHIDQNMLSTFLLCLKRNISQTLKSNSCKQVFPKCIYHGYYLLRWIFLFPMKTGRILFLFKLIVTQSFGATTMFPPSSKQVFLKKSVFYIHYLHNNIAILLRLQRPKIKLLLYNYSSQNLFLDSYFRFFQLMNVSQFFLVNGIFKT